MPNTVKLSAFRVLKANGTSAWLYAHKKIHMHTGACFVFNIHSLSIIFMTMYFDTIISILSVVYTTMEGAPLDGML